MLTPYTKGDQLPPHLGHLFKRFNASDNGRNNPWKQVQVDLDPQATVIAAGIDVAGRLQRLYSNAHVAAAKADKFNRVKLLLEEWDSIGEQLEAGLSLAGKDYEAALVAKLIYDTGMRPGGGECPNAAVQAHGATTLLCKHVSLCIRGVRLKFTGKKGVGQNVLVVDSRLIEELTRRKRQGWPARWLFGVSSSKVNHYIGTLGSGQYTAKDFRTARGTRLALQLLGNRQRLPRLASKRKDLVNKALDKVAKMLGNTRAVSRSSYVDPSILERFLV